MNNHNALIVLNYNDALTTIRFIEDVRSKSCIDHIVIVDNHSSDDSYESLLHYADDKIDVIQTKSNGGYAKGNNYGVWYAINRYKPYYVLISNPDVRFADSVIDKIEKVLLDNPNAGAVACKMRCTNGKKKAEAWKLPTYGDCIRENLIILKKICGDKTRYDDLYLKGEGVVKVDVVPGSLFGINSTTFIAIAGFDESTFLYGEENLMASRLKEKGFQSYLIKDDEYLHDHSVSIDKNVKNQCSSHLLSRNYIQYKKLRMGLDSRVIYARKVLKAGKVCECLLYLTFYVGVLNYLILRSIFDLVRN
ncbi:MAG: glycosyltransferase family 2 protein [Lachnospiraceae bacterium]|nr:glycosyltransferase family 2 protein [Lachnospiraceae bacterium]